jgi:uncharacterized protein (TIGR02271 family)
MNQTVIAVFDSYADAQSALNALYQQGGFTQADVKLSPAEASTQARQQALRTPAATTESTRWGIGDFFRSLFGTDQHGDDAGLYAEAVRRGSYLLSVDAENAGQAERAAEILKRFNAVDLDQRSSIWRSGGWTGYQSDAPLYTDDQIQKEHGLYSQTTLASTSGSQTDTSATSGQTIPVIEEQLNVGKRVVQTGGVRIYSHVTETPVQESVQLREEHVKIERTAVNQPASAADIDAFKEGTVEVRETAEEAVVAKSARVVEEVHVGKEVTEHTETVSDTVRRTDVEVEPLATQTTGGTLSDDEYRQHWKTAYGSSGGQYEDYASAYRYGATLASQQKYHGYRWEELEPKVKSEWESTHAGSPWEQTQQAVRYGWEKMTGR